MASVSKRVLYIGVTTDLPERVRQHKLKVFPDSFTAKYNCVLLVYYDHYESISQAIAEEKRLKGASRKYKEEIINRMNPDWIDLSNNIVF